MKKTALALHNFLLSVYHKILSYSKSKFAPYLLAFLSFSDCSFFIIPPDILLIPMCLAKVKKSFYYALITAVSSALGAALGFVIGAFAFNHIGELLIHSLNYEQEFQVIKKFYDKYNTLWLIASGFLPIPYLLVTMLSGFLKISFLKFILITSLSRGGRFFVLGGLIFVFGDRVKKIIESHTIKVAFALVVLAFIVLGYYIF